MEPFTLYCIYFVAVINSIELIHKIYKKKRIIKKYIIDKYNGNNKSHINR